MTRLADRNANAGRMSVPVSRPEVRLEWSIDPETPAPVYEARLERSSDRSLPIASDRPLLVADAVTKDYGDQRGCFDVSLAVWPGEVIAIVGESGSGKSTFIMSLAGLMRPDRGSVRFSRAPGDAVDLYAVPERTRRTIMRTELGFVHQNPRDGLRQNVSAGANIAERLMAQGLRHFGRIRDEASAWLRKVEIDATRIDDLPATYSGGMQQRLQIARNLVTHPKLMFMDEPTAGLDVSVQARILDLLRRLCREFGLAVVVVTHDLAVARVLAHRTLVMQRGLVVEAGLTDRILEDPQHPYTQLLVSSQLQV